MRKKDDDILDFKKDEDFEDTEDEENTIEENDEPVEKFTDEEDENEEEILEEIEESQENSIVPKLSVEEKVEEELKEEKNSNKVLIIICGILLVVIVLLVFFLLHKNNNDDDNNNKPNNNNNSSEISRPSNNIEYITLNQNYFGFTCTTDNKGNKLEELKKGSVIKCEFTFELFNNVSELYFDLSNSSNVKYLRFDNNSDYSIQKDDNNTFKFSTDKQINKLSDSIYYYFEVTSDTDKTGYVEINNVVFKDNDNKYYKVLNKITSFPPKKTNKIYIYEYTDFENQKCYSASKVKKEDEKEIDTFTCKDENCDVVTLAEVNFLIKDEDLILYDLNNKSKQSINNFDIKDVNNYNYEIVLDENKEAYGVIFLGDYVDKNDCDSFEDFCVSNGLSGNNLGYYSFKEGNFKISVDYDFIGNSISNGTKDIGLLLNKNDKYGYFNYDIDDLVIDMTNKITNIDYDNDLGTLLIENKDKNGEYYYTFKTLDNKTYTPNKEDVKVLGTTNLYYLSLRNRNGKKLYYLFNSKLEQLSSIKYVVEKDIISSDSKLIIRPNELYETYDKDGYLLYTSEFEEKNIYTKTTNYLIVNKDGSIELYDLKNNSILAITNIVNGTKFKKANEEANGTVYVYIIEETNVENTNGNKYTINPKTKEINKEAIQIED